MVEAEHRQAVDPDGVLVEAGGEAEGAVQTQPERLGAQLLVAGGERGGDEVRRPGTRATRRIQRKARWWACSGSIRWKSRVKRILYMMSS
ncbi:hypothetical protein GCM10023238_27320 [Streptomyces heliomycini]